MKVEFSEAAKKEFDEIVKRYPQKRAALLTVLHLAQREFGWLSRDVMEYVGQLLDIPVGEVYDTASFYTMFYKKPVGKYHIQVCHTLSCALRGARNIYEHLEQKLGIKDGEVTPDGKFSLIKVECLGSCGTAPVVQINDDYYEGLTIEKLDDILNHLDKNSE
ncbi:MAG: NADH-quinone oxidoreductase subunit NuoE [Calditrichaeota bacterium]|nr:NADH-quinone oxidoreductase subunit NuoE [Calditrichota bacterium]